LRARGGVQRVALAAALAAFAAHASRAAAQGAPPAHTAVWASFGMGRAFLPQGADIGLHLEGSYQFGSNVVSVRTGSASSIVNAIINAITGEPGNVDAHDFAVLFGRATAPAQLYGSAAAGVGLVVADRDSAGTRTSSQKFTVPVEGQVAWRPLRYLGLVLCGYASFNSVRTFSGVTLGLQLGRLR
jgi:hypothetical protein